MQKADFADKQKLSTIRYKPEYSSLMILTDYVSIRYHQHVKDQVDLKRSPVNKWKKKKRSLFIGLFIVATHIDKQREREC